MAKIQKKVQMIADDLQKKIDIASRQRVEKASASPAAPEVRSVEPLPKGPISFLGSKGKVRKSHKKKKETVNVNAFKKEPDKGPVEEKEERLTGYAGLARRIARRIVGEVRGRARFWFDD